MTRCSVKAWLAVVLWIALIFSTIPFVRHLREAFVARWPAEAIGIGVMLVVVGVAVVSITALRRLRKPPADVLWLLAAAGATILWTAALMGQPEEAVHFLEYGVLGLLLYRALRLQIPDATVFVAAALVGVIVGTADEIIQWIVPGRYFDFRDIVLNGGASVLVQIVVWRMAPPPSLPVNRTSLRLLCRLLAVWVLMLAFCTSATPGRVSRAARFLPELRTTDSAICDYGHSLVIEPTTRFRSRLTFEGLGRNDQTRAQEVAALLDASRGAYKEFLLANPSSEDPFSYEARVHIFTRDRRLAEALRAESDSSKHRELMTAAFRENLILETAFGTTIERSSFAWSPPKRARIEEAQDPDSVYTSPVGSHLMTAITENRLRGLLLVSFFALVVCDLVVMRSQSRLRAG